MMEEREWMVALRKARYKSLTEAARAAGLSPTLLRTIEYGGVTLPEIAGKLGKAYGMRKAQVAQITCQATVERRAREAAQSAQEKRRDRMREVYEG